MSCRDRPSVTSLKTADNTQVDKSHCASIFNKVFIKSFSNPFSNTDPTYRVNTLSFMDHVIINPDGVSKIINDLKLSSATGKDEINSKFLKATEARFIKNLLPTTT